MVRTLEFAKSLAAALGDGGMVLLRGHGCVVVGRTPQEVVARCIAMDRNARVQEIAHRLGDYIPLDAGECEDVRNPGAAAGPGQPGLGVLSAARGTAGMTSPAAGAPAADNLHLLRADHVGGLPRPGWLRARQAAFQRGEISAADLERDHQTAVTELGWMMRSRCGAARRRG
jgi:Class II Aldolase and Adducin N-terminal domain